MNDRLTKADLIRISTALYRDGVDETDWALNEKVDRLANQVWVMTASEVSRDVHGKLVEVTYELADNAAARILISNKWSFRFANSDSVEADELVEKIVADLQALSPIEGVILCKTSRNPPTPA